MLEKEQKYYKQKIAFLEDQLLTIADLKQLAPRIRDETHLETLSQSLFRVELETEASKKVDQLAFKQVYPEVSKQDELAAVIRAIVPQAMRSTLLNSTVSQRVRKEQKQEDQRRKEHPKIAPVYDYDNKFSYKKYLRDERIPATIYSNAPTKAPVKKQEMDSEIVSGGKNKRSGKKDDTHSSPRVSMNSILGTT